MYLCVVNGFLPLHFLIAPGLYPVSVLAFPVAIEVKSQCVTKH